MWEFLCYDPRVLIQINWLVNVYNVVGKIV